MLVDRVLLCSLLQNDRSVFAYLALAFELFALFPLWCRHVAAFAPELHYRCAALLVALATALLLPTSKSACAAYLGLVLLVTFLCPLALVSMQRFKFAINGPWDEARVRELPTLED